ncbi:very short patch repair endonuclease [Lactobacillus delbrueckii subsp. bulgaricus]|uniref:very short patch repair endonuclease n=1 Tax=Lactobacillus delbrueckii TaxID=1584 RepID=UPI001BFF4A03|nr:very short patch repair endonuclease [Lactobacillus delbrueckii]MBT8916907.1 very short patch repair endonuclease [Lactobacillus delbrueckii subsp. bulgaricus]MBT8934098.1 very short patch repair endonuclease [Lactobacillus delbrueckii subsp. bulgaricus]MBT8986953.1 very short patch repair endonuclease [Lactobacillus delbrueckii subsp. bulgaricus]MDA3801547.1 very short patch repair endonuclease [Lactobacillus delbrueckii]
MAYVFNSDLETRKRMSKVHTVDGKDEVIIRKILWKNGIRYRKNYKELPGRPDIAITRYKIAVFIDGEFWHGYDWENYQKYIKSNRDYWIPKIERNMKHDQEVNAQLEAMGWTVLRFWSKQVLKNPEYYAELIMLYTRTEE